MFFSCIDSKGIENIQPVVKPILNYLVNMVDGCRNNIVDIEKIQNEK